MLSVTTGAVLLLSLPSGRVPDDQGRLQDGLADIRSVFCVDHLQKELGSSNPDLSYLLINAA
jgi:hypothetical protein